MTKKHIIAGFSLLVSLSLLLTACSTPQATPEAAPTVDANAIYTQAAQTVQASQAQTQAAQPAVLPTNTPAPTFTMDPAIATALTATANAAVQPGADPALASPTATSGSLFSLPTATQGVAGPIGDKCEWVSNSPADNTEIPKNASFDATIRVRNSGTTTWDNRFALRYYAGDRMGAPSDFYVQRQVAPNDTYDFMFELKAPDSTGKKELLLVVQNPDGRNMCFINIPLTITE